MNVIESTWRLVSARMIERGMPIREILNLRETFAAGVNAAAVALVTERAGFEEMVAAATRVEMS